MDSNNQDKSAGPAASIEATVKRALTRASFGVNPIKTRSEADGT